MSIALGAPTVRVLLVEDNPADADLIRDVLEDTLTASTVAHASPIEIVHAVRLAEGVELLARGNIDAVLLDLSLPDSQGIDTFRRLHTLLPSIPIVVLSGIDDEELAALAVREGAQDYLIKGQVSGDVLPRAIRYAMARQRSEDERADLLREQAARAEAEAAVHERDEFLAAVSHDLKTPLSAIKAQAQLLGRRLRVTGELSPQDILTRLGRIEETTEQMARILDDLIELSRLSGGGPLALARAPTDLLALVRRAMAECQSSTESHHLRLETTHHTLIANIDSVRIERVIANLLTNAVKYTPGGGDIVLTITTELDAAGPWAVLSVRDCGLGVPAADLSRIFERYYRGRNVVGRIGGTGIGLSGARRIVEEHSGTISVESLEGSGSTFQVRLPLH